jgi:multidrug resistance efflux pump
MWARRDQAAQALAECSLRAPEAGTVLRVGAGKGDVLSGYAQQPAILFCGAGQRVVRAEVEQEFAGRVAVGQPAVVADDTRAGWRWRGRVEWVADWYLPRRQALPDPSLFQDVRTVECLIRLDPGQPPLRIGQRVRVLINPAEQ